MTSHRDALRLRAVICCTSCQAYHELLETSDVRDLMRREQAIGWWGNVTLDQATADAERLKAQGIPCGCHCHRYEGNR